MMINPDDYKDFSAAALHRERARLLRIVVLQRYMEMRVISTSTEDPVQRITCEADSAMYERLLKLDAELEEVANKKEV